MAGRKLESGAKCTLKIEGRNHEIELDTRDDSTKPFSSGAIGHNASFKLDGKDGRKYQVTINAVVIGSKGGK